MKSFKSHWETPPSIEFEQPLEYSNTDNYKKKFNKRMSNSTVYEYQLEKSIKPKTMKKKKDKIVPVRKRWNIFVPNRRSIANSKTPTKQCSQNKRKSLGYHDTHKTHLSEYTSKSPITAHKMKSRGVKYRLGEDYSPVNQFYTPRIPKKAIESRYSISNKKKVIIIHYYFIQSCAVTSSKYEITEKNNLKLLKEAQRMQNQLTKGRDYQQLFF